MWSVFGQYVVTVRALNSVVASARGG